MRPTIPSTSPVLIIQKVSEELRLVHRSAFEEYRQLDLAAVEKLLCVDVVLGL